MNVSANRTSGTEHAGGAGGFLKGLQGIGEPIPDFDRYGDVPVLGRDRPRVTDPAEPRAAYQTMLAADALRYLVLQMCAAKSSGHPGGFASSAEAYASLVMLGHRNIVTEVGHHAPGYYAAMFLDGSLEEMGIRTVEDLSARFRERGGLLGHLSGAIPGLLSPAGPLGQGQHFAMAGAWLHRDTLFPVFIGDGGVGEPYVASAFLHFITAFPEVANFLPVLVWNGYSQEHHAMNSLWDDRRMEAYWKAHGFRNVRIVSAREFDDSGQKGEFVDSTRFSIHARVAFTSAVLEAADAAARAALGGEQTVLIIKQLKGAGVHALGASSHNLYPHHSLDEPGIREALERRALPAEAWELVRENFRHAGGGPAARVAVTERPAAPPEIGTLSPKEYPIDGREVATTVIGALAAEVGRRDERFIVTDADGNAASGVGNLNKALGIRHPSDDPAYEQRPSGRVYEPLSEDACAGLAAALSLYGGRSLWVSYESFAVNGLPIWQTVTQAMAELRRPVPAMVSLFTAGALEQGRNGWTHQRPEIEAYFAAMMRNGNVYPLFPPDANTAQAAYLWALEQRNKGIAIIASKSPVPVRMDMKQAREAVDRGAVVLRETKGTKMAVLAVVGDLALGPAFDAADRIAAEGMGVRVVSVVNPRRLFRERDIPWKDAAEPDGRFLDDAEFERFFAGDMLAAITGGAGAIMEPLLLRSGAPVRELFCWKRGETTAGAAELFDINGLSGETIARNMLMKR